jgi:SAM-dependent methyltransferase
MNGRDTPSKYELYEASVQSPDPHVELLQQMYRECVGSEPKSLREDFCGTFAISAAWVKSSPSRTAVGLDLDPEPLAYGRSRRSNELTRAQLRRISAKRQNVLQPTTQKFDLIMAGNFSFFIFKERKLLLRYLRAAARSLKPNGILTLEMMGGPGSIETVRERKAVFLRKKGKKKRSFTYFWDQKSFDPIQANGQYAIHFHLPDGTKLRDAFTYDWRIWSIPEVRDAMLEAGFDDVAVYWEGEHEGEGTGEYLRSERGDNAYSWIAHVCGLKNGTKSPARGKARRGHSYRRKPHSAKT